MVRDSDTSQRLFIQENVEQTRTKSRCAAVSKKTKQMSHKNILVGRVDRAEAGALGGDDGVRPGGTVLVGRDGGFR